MKKKIGFFLLWIGWMLVIFYMSSQEGNSSAGLSDKIVAWVYQIFPISKEILSFLIRKGAHFTEYGILGILTILNFQPTLKRPYLWSLTFGVFYAAVDEFHQLFVLGRNGSMIDVGLDMVGFLTFLVVFYFLSQKLRKKSILVDKIDENMV